MLVDDGGVGDAADADGADDHPSCRPHHHHPDHDC